MNGVVALLTEVPTMTMKNVYDVGFIVLVANAMIAFLLNVSVVFLVRSISRFHEHWLLTEIDWKSLCSRPYPLRCPQGHSPRCCFDDDLGNTCLWNTILRLQHCAWWTDVLQVGRWTAQATFGTSWKELARVWSEQTSYTEDCDLRTSHAGHVHPSRRTGTYLCTSTDRQATRLPWHSWSWRH